MTDADEISRAARLMRDRAQAAAPGPWGVGNGTDVARGVEITGRGSYTAIQSVAEETDDWDTWNREEAVSVEEGANAAHIAGMHPGVVLKLADWLDEHARELDAASGLYEACDSEGDTMAALGIARAYLDGACGMTALTATEQAAVDALAAYVEAVPEETDDLDHAEMLALGRHVTDAVRPIIAAETLRDAVMWLGSEDFAGDWLRRRADEYEREATP